VQEEVECYFPKSRVQLLVPVQRAKKAASEPGSQVVQKVSLLRPGTVILVDHNHLHLVAAELMAALPETYVCIDEVHKALNKTLRTQACHQIADVARFSTVMTGTPVIGENLKQLIPWLQDIVPFPVHPANCVVAMSHANSHRVDTGVLVVEEEVYDQSVEKDAHYRSLAPSTLGGTMTLFDGARDLRKLFSYAWELLDPKMVESTVNSSRTGGVFLVARDKPHQIVLERLVTDALLRAGIPGKVQVMSNSVNMNTSHDVRVLIGRQSLSEGFSACFASTMVTGVYLSNQAQRDQLRGRIDRLSQKSKSVKYITVHGGVLSLVHNKHLDAASIAAVIKGLASLVILQ
jgi:hypothetical protein